MIPFAEFAPDQPAFNSGASGQVENVIPLTAQSYGPMKSLASVGNALTARCQGAGSFRAPDGTIFNVAGDKTKLYRWNGTTWSDISRTTPAYNTADEEGWSFAQFGTTVIAVNGVDDTQSIDITLSGSFANLSGAPKARFATTVRDFVFLGRPDGKQNRVRWCAQNNVTNWTIGIDQADEQEFPEGGRVMGLVGGQYATIFLETAIQRGTYVGPDLIFQFDSVSTERGCAASGSIASYQELIFFLAGDGFFMMTAGQGETAIGDQKVDAWFWNNVNQAHMHRVTATIDPRRKLYVVAFPSSQSLNGTPDTMLIYNWTIGRWSKAVIAVDILYRALANLGYTLDALDAIYPSLDSMPISLDSALLLGSPLAKLAAFDTSRKLAFFEGANMAASIESIEAELTPQARSFVRSIRPYVDGGSPLVSLGSRERQGDTVNWSQEVAQDATGNCPFRNAARYHRARLRIPAGEVWTHAQGLDVEVEAEGRR